MRTRIPRACGVAHRAVPARRARSRRERGYLSRILAAVSLGENDPGSSHVSANVFDDDATVLFELFPVMVLRDGTLVRCFFMAVDPTDAASRCSWQFGEVLLDSPESFSGCTGSLGVRAAPRPGLTWREVGVEDDVVIDVLRSPKDAADRQVEAEAHRLPPASHSAPQVRRRPPPTTRADPWGAARVTTADPAAKPVSIVSVWTLALIALALLMLLLMAGVPGEEHRAGDGSDKLRHGWAQKQAEAAAAQPAPPAPSDAPAR